MSMELCKKTLTNWVYAHRERIYVPTALGKTILLKMTYGRSSLVIATVVSRRSRKKIDVGSSPVTLRFI